MDPAASGCGTLQGKDDQGRRCAGSGGVSAVEHQAGSIQGKETHHQTGTEESKRPKCKEEVDPKDQCQLHRRRYLHHSDLQGTAAA